MRSFEITNSTPTIDTEINRRCKGERDSAKVLWRWSWDLILGVLSPLPAPSSAPGSDPDYTGNMWPISLALPALTWLPTLQLWGESQPLGEGTMSPIAIEDPDTTSSVEFIQFSSNVEFLHDRNITKHLMLDNTWY